MRAIQMPVAFATKTRQGTLNDPSIEAQAAWGQRAGAQISQQALHQGGTLHQSHDGELVDSVLDQLDALAETQTIGVHVGLGGGLMHQEAHSIVQQQQPIELLQHGLGTATAQGLLGQTQMAFVLIDAEFDFPAFVIEGDQLLGRSLLRLHPQITSIQ